MNATNTGGNIEGLGCAESGHDGGKDGGLEKHFEKIETTLCSKECSVDARSIEKNVNNECGVIENDEDMQKGHWEIFILCGY